MIVSLNRKQIVYMSLFTLLTIFVIVMPLNREILLTLNLVLCILTVTKAKFSLISIWSVITNYVILNVYIFDVTGNAYGILNYVRNLKFIPMLQYMMIFNMILIFWTTCTNFCNKESRMLEYIRTDVGKNYSVFCCVIAIACAFIAFPQKPFLFDSNERFSALLPGNGWNHFSICALLAVLPNLRKYRFVRLTYLLVMFWFLSHYERVDVIGLIVLLSLLYLVEKEGKKRLKNVVLVMALVFVAYALMTYIGNVRMGEKDLSLNLLLTKLVSQNTASDLGYVYNVSCEYASKNNLMLGKTYLRYLIELIPVVNADSLNVGAMLCNMYNTPGGEFILSEPLINFGLAGVIVVPNILIGLVYMIVNKLTNYRNYVYIFIVATAFRYLWYGLGFIETSLVWFIPFLYIFCKLFNGNMNRIGERND